LIAVSPRQFKLYQNTCVPHSGDVNAPYFTGGVWAAQGEILQRPPVEQLL